LLSVLVFQTLGCAELFQVHLDAQVDEFLVFGHPDLYEQMVPLSSGDISETTLQIAVTNADRLRLVDARLYVTDSAQEVGEHDTVNFLKSLKIAVRAPGLDERTIAFWNAAAHEDPTEVEFNVLQNVDILPYVEGGMTIRLIPIGIVPSNNVSLEGNLTLRADAL